MTNSLRLASCLLAPTINAPVLIHQDAGFLPMPRLGIILAPAEIQHRGLSMKHAMKWTFAICAAVASLAGASLAQEKPALTKPASAKPAARPRPVPKSAATASPLSAASLGRRPASASHVSLTPANGASNSFTWRTRSADLQEN